MTGGPVELRWSVQVVEAEAIQRASYALSRTCTAETTREGEEWVVRLFPRASSGTEIGTEIDAEIAHRFRQEVVDQGLRLAIARRTEPLRNAVFAMAFSRLPGATTDTSR